MLTGAGRKLERRKAGSLRMKQLFLGAGPGNGQLRGETKQEKRGILPSGGNDGETRNSEA